MKNFAKNLDRILAPHVRSGERFIEVSWDTALNTIASELKKIVKVYGGDSIAFIGCSKCSNEENYIIQKFARFLGSNNIDNCARLCHAISVEVLEKSLGLGAQTNPFSDLLYSKAILIIGYNPVVSHPPLASIIMEARKRGAKVIVIDVRESETAKMADIFIQVKKPGLDYMILLCMINIILSKGLCNKEFLLQKTEGLDGFLSIVKKFDSSFCEEMLMIPRKLIEEAAEEFALAGCGSILWGMGVTQHANAYNNVAAIVNLALLLGYVGRKGCGLYPVRGQNNVQGACDMGCLPNYLPGYARVDDEKARKLFQSAWGVDWIPSIPGYTSVEVFEKALNGDIKALFIIGENPVVSHPNRVLVEKALQNIELVVVNEIRWSETAYLADYVLASAAHTEKDGSYTNSERRVQWSFKVFDPPGNAVPDWVVFSRLGDLMGLRNWRSYESAENILMEISNTVPIYYGITPERLKASEDGLVWPCHNEVCSQRLYQNKFETPTGKARFLSIESNDFKNFSKLILTTFRLGECYNTTLCINNTKGVDIDTAFLSRQDAHLLNIRDGDLIEIATRCGKSTFHAKIDDKIPKGVIAIPWHKKANIITCNSQVGSEYVQPLKSVEILEIKILETSTRNKSIH